MLKKLLIAGGIGLAVYLVNTIRKEYDKNVNDYNELSDFVQQCNFYTYKNRFSSDENSRFKKTTKIMPDGSKQTVTRDIVTGFQSTSYS